MISVKNLWFWFGGIWFGVGLPIFVIGLYLGFQYATVTKRLDLEGTQAEGMVLTKAITRSSHSSRRNGNTRTPNYSVTFRNPGPSGAITGEAQVTIQFILQSENPCGRLMSAGQGGYPGRIDFLAHHDRCACRGCWFSAYAPRRMCNHASNAPNNTVSRLVQAATGRACSTNTRIRLLSSTNTAGVSG